MANKEQRVSEAPLKVEVAVEDLYGFQGQTIDGKSFSYLLNWYSFDESCKSLSLSLSHLLCFVMEIGRRKR